VALTLTALPSPEPDPRPPLFLCADLLEAFTLDATAAYEDRQHGRTRGARTGFADLDADLGGYLAPGLHVLHGAPGTGKTALALQMAAATGCPALYVTTEMGALELFRRVVARVTGTYLGRFRTGELHPDHVAELAQRTAQAVPELAILDATTAPAPLEEVRLALALAQGLSPHALLVIDSLHTWAASLAAVTRVDRFDDVTEYKSLNFGILQLVALASERSVPILAIAERNRASKAGGMDASAGTRKFEYSAATVLELDKDADAVPDREATVAVKLKVTKNRNGEAYRSHPMRFSGRLQSFTA
jgi:replicative DNA helicase